MAITELGAVVAGEVDSGGSLNEVLQATHHPLLHRSRYFGEFVGAGGLFRYSGHHHHPGGHLTKT